jgi:glycerophosphoryl diester phosphodiesterase
MLIIGHRGARAQQPENTLRALEEGIRCADFVEIDLRRSRDGELVVIHDPTVDRTTNGTGPVRTFSLTELKSLDAGKGEKIPTFQEVLDLVAGRCGLLVEIKEPGTEEQIIARIRDAGVEDLFVVSFHLSAIDRVRDSSTLKTGLIVSRKVPDPVDLASRAGVDLVLPRLDLVTGAMVRKAHRQGILLFAWTVNRVGDIHRMARLGVDGIATDDPCFARGVVNHEETGEPYQP